MITYGKMVKILKPHSIKCWQWYGATSTFRHCYWICKLEQPLWKTIWEFYLMLLCLVTSVVSDSVTLWTVARQAPLSVEFSRKEYWNGLPSPPPGDLPYPGIKSRLLCNRPGSMGLQRVGHDWATNHSTAHNLYPVSFS